MRDYLQPANSALVTHGQLVAPFSSPPSQHGTTVGGLHTDTKAMCLGAVAIIRLKRTFWHSGSCFLSAFTVGAAINFAARLGKSAKAHCG